MGYRPRGPQASPVPSLRGVQISCPWLGWPGPCSRLPADPAEADCGPTSWAGAGLASEPLLHAPLLSIRALGRGALHVGVKVTKDGQLRVPRDDIWPGHGKLGEVRGQAAAGGGWPAFGWTVEALGPGGDRSQLHHCLLETSLLPRQPGLRAAPKVCCFSLYSGAGVLKMQGPGGRLCEDRGCVCPLPAHAAMPPPTRARGWARCPRGSRKSS